MNVRSVSAFMITQLICRPFYFMYADFMPSAAARQLFIAGGDVLDQMLSAAAA